MLPDPGFVDETDLQVGPQIKLWPPMVAIGSAAHMGSAITPKRVVTPGKIAVEVSAVNQKWSTLEASIEDGATSLSETGQRQSLAQRIARFLSADRNGRIGLGHPRSGRDSGTVTGLASLDLLLVPAGPS